MGGEDCGESEGDGPPSQWFSSRPRNSSVPSNPAIQKYGSLDKSSVQLSVGSVEGQSRASQSFLSRCCVGSIRDAAARPIQASELGETRRNGLRRRLPFARHRRVYLWKVRLTARPTPVSVSRPARTAAPGYGLICSRSISLVAGVVANLSGEFPFVGPSLRVCYNGVGLGGG